MLVLSGGSFEVTWVGNLEVAGPVEDDPMGNSEGTRVGNKRGISYGGIPDITLGVADRSKLWGDEVPGKLL